MRHDIRIYEDLLDDISKDDVKQKDVKSLVAGLDTDSAYDPSDINPAEYEFMINFEIYHLIILGKNVTSLGMADNNGMHT